MGNRLVNQIAHKLRIMHLKQLGPQSNVNLDQRSREVDRVGKNFLEDFIKSAEGKPNLNYFYNDKDVPKFMSDEVGTRFEIE